MSDDATDTNPYAPPRAEAEPPGRRARSRHRARADLREALERLDEHVADAEAVAYDRKAAGPRIRPLTWITGVLLVASVALIAAGMGEAVGAMLPVGVGLGIVSGTLLAVTLSMDLTLVQRGQPSSPEDALKSFFKAIPRGRHGYAWAALSPTAREQSVGAPVLDPVRTGSGTFSMSQESGLKAYTGTFARQGQGQARTMAVKRVTVRAVDGDVAEVDVVLAFQSWPQWVSIVLVVSFVLFRPAVLIGAVLYFVTRKRREVSVTKTMLRGQDGAWYVYDADVIEGAADAR
jgi:hypothetical protein